MPSDAPLLQYILPSANNRETIWLLMSNSKMSLLLTHSISVTQEGRQVMVSLEVRTPLPTFRIVFSDQPGSCHNKQNMLPTHIFIRYYGQVEN